MGLSRLYTLPSVWRADGLGVNTLELVLFEDFCAVWSRWWHFYTKHSTSVCSFLGIFFPPLTYCNKPALEGQAVSNCNEASRMFMAVQLSQRSDYIVTPCHTSTTTKRLSTQFSFSFPLYLPVSDIHSSLHLAWASSQAHRRRVITLETSTLIHCSPLSLIKEGLSLSATSASSLLYMARALMQCPLRKYHSQMTVTPEAGRMNRVSQDAIVCWIW